MKEDLLKQLLESVLGKSKSARGGDEAVFTCPSCNHHKKELTYLECKSQFTLGVLESRSDLNDNILGKFFDKDFA